MNSNTSTVSNVDSGYFELVIADSSPVLQLTILEAGLESLRSEAEYNVFDASGSGATFHSASPFP